MSQSRSNMTSTEWNERYPVGTPIRYRRTARTFVETFTNTAAWTPPHGSALVGLAGGRVVSLGSIEPVEARK